MRPVKKKDSELWERVKATVKPLASNRSPIDLLNAALDPAPEPPKKKKQSTLRVRPDSDEPRIQISLAPTARTMDPATARRIARGRINIEGKIDLHGKTQVEAHQHLWRFLEFSHRTGRRTVLVITGKGRTGEGILRTAVPRWLAEPEFAMFVSGHQEAHNSHGGSGALYVRIRANREIDV